MKIVIELKNIPKKDDVLVFDGTYFECISKSKFLKSVTDDIKSLKTRMTKAEEDIAELQEDMTEQQGGGE